MGGLVTHQQSNTNSGDKITELRNTYTWWDSAQASQVDYDPDHDSGEALNYAWDSTYAYDALGHLSSVDIVDGRSVGYGDGHRQVNFIADAQGQILQRNKPTTCPPASRASCTSISAG